MKIGLISNPKSNANRVRGGVAGQIEAGHDILTAQPANHDALETDLKRFAKEGVELIAIDGGDGTVRDVVSSVHHAYPTQWPTFALLPSGKTNVIAEHVGGFGTGLNGWRALVAAQEAGKLTAFQNQCAALEISWPNRPEPMRRGFLLGCAAFTDGVQMANDSIHPVGIAKGLAVAMAIGGILRRALTKRSKGKRPSGEAGQVIVDGAQINGDRHFLMLASTLNRLTMGIKPFWDEGRGDIHWLDIPAPAKRLAIGALMIALGKRRDWMVRSGYASGRAEAIDLRFDAPFVLDGEAYRSARARADCCFAAYYICE